jgi:hypothetical protein
MTDRSLRFAILLGSLMLGWQQTGSGIQLRSYVPARHDRFTGYPTAPAWNDSAWFVSRDYTGIGWAPVDLNFQRQFALITPTHLVGATHYKPNVGSLVRFLNASGVIVERTVASLTPIQNELSQDTDLTVITLSSPLLASDLVSHFPYLNLATEADYLDLALVVFGWHVKAGKGRLFAIEDIEEGDINRTRMLRFDYSKQTGDPDDSYLEGGDSGSPTFALAGGHPALIGIHSTADENPAKRMSYDTFVPHYVTQLNSVLAPTGYQMTPAYPPPVSLTVEQATPPAKLLQANPGSWQFQLVNRSDVAATNLTIELSFPGAAGPTSLTAPGWIITPAGGGIWRLRSGTLAAGATVSITAHWLNLGLTESLHADMLLASDGSASQQFQFTTPLAPSYNAWAVNLTDPSPSADPDGDSVANLPEYAFGGDPMAKSLTNLTGARLLPTLRVEDQTAKLEFFVREDAVNRGISYVVEYSETLAADAWTSTPPVGTTVVDTPTEPPTPGWLRRTVSFETAGSARFCRVRVELDEG